MDTEEFFHERRYSPIESEFPCPLQYPLYYKAHKQVHVIEPGQKLYIPFGWFHMVYSEGDELNVAVNFFTDVKFRIKEAQYTPETPRVEKSELPPIDILKVFGNNQVKIIHTKTGLFASDFLKSKYGSIITTKEKTIQEFLKDKDRGDYIMQNKCSIPGGNIWINWGCIRTLLHYDTSSNWLHQVSGRKRVILFPPEDRPLLYTLNPYPVELVQQLVSDPHVTIKRQDKSPEDVRKAIEYIGARDKIEIPCNRWIVRTVEDFTIKKDYIEIWFLIDNTKLTINMLKYSFYAGDYVKFPNHPSYLYNIQTPTLIVISEKDDQISNTQGST